MNVSSISNGKAQTLEPHSWRALVASLMAASSILGASLAVVLLLQLSPWSGVSRSIRSAYIYESARGRQRLSDCMYKMWDVARETWRSQAIWHKLCESPPEIHPRAGCEAVLFLHFLRSLAVVFGCLSLGVTPSFVCFNRWAPAQAASADWLNRFSWTNLPAKDARLYWFYAGMMPATTGVCLWQLSCLLRQALALRHGCLEREQKARPPWQATTYFVLATNIPTDWHIERIRSHFLRWMSSIRNVERLPLQRPCPIRVAQVDQLVRNIEGAEASFMAELAQRVWTGSVSDAMQIVPPVIAQRYASTTETHCQKDPSIPATLSIASLYLQLQSLLRSVAESRSSPNGTTVSWRLPAAVRRWWSPKKSAVVLLSVDDYCTAQAMAAYPQSSSIRGCRAYFLGSTSAGLIPTRLAHSQARRDVGQGVFRLVAAPLVLLWAFPMAMVGGLSQLSTLLQVVWGLSSQVVPSGLVAAMQGILPAIATSLLLCLFPWLLRQCLRLASHPTRFEEELAMYRYYFAFLFVNLFLTTSISSGIIPTCFVIAAGGVVEIPRVLATNLPLAGNYYLSYLLIQCMNLVTTTLLRPWAFARWWWACTWQTMRTPRERADLLKVVLYRVCWGEIYPFYTVLAVIGLTYALLTPFILPVATVTFYVSYLCFHRLLSEACFIPIDTLGHLYFRACFGLFWGVYAQQLTLMGLFMLKFNPHDKVHDLGQLGVSSLTLFGTIQYHIWLRGHLRPFIYHQEGAIGHANRQDDVHRHLEQHDADADDVHTIDPAVELVDLVAGQRVSATHGTQTIWLHQDLLNIGSMVERCVLREVLSGTDVRIRTASSHLRLQPGCEPMLQSVSHVQPL